MVSSPDQAERLREAIDRKLAAHPDLLRAARRGHVNWRISGEKIELDLNLAL
ncbi:MAG TPA: hypothetical protein PKA49_12640 [Tepidiformaceae bacterium]|nr:hypothetical protein [Tepidiformaceae bacterium]